MTHIAHILASFTTPMHIGTNPQSLFWMVPLIATIAIVYKATKVDKIDTKKYPWEVASLFGSILGFIIIAGLILVIIGWFFNEKLPALLT